MRAIEFTINIPINIKMSGDGDFEVDTGEQDPDVKTAEHERNPDQAIMVPPGQQEIELAKSEQGKDSEIIQQLTYDEVDDPEEEKEG